MGLLMGITSTKTDPMLLYTLPNGLRIYQTPFKDRDGCDLAYGGPHQIFSRSTVKKEAAKSYNQFVGELMDKAIYPDPLAQGAGRSLALQIPMACPNGTLACFYPTPLERDVLEKLGSLEHDDPVDEDPRVTVVQSCYKANIPRAWLRVLVDQDDIFDNLSYRCPKCSNCKECQHNNKYRAVSVQERREQVVIEESVTLDLEQIRVTVQLLLMKDPVKYFVDKHQSNSNYGQALRVYVSQCRKEPRILKGIRKAHWELVERGFMIPLESLD